MLKNKPIIILLAILLFFSTSASIYGYVNSNKEHESSPKPENNTKNMVYEYYLDDLIVETMPSQTDEEGNTYEFSKYVCDNNIQLTFDETNWSYNVPNGSKGTCKLYFVKSEYIVEITATNGLVNGEEANHSFNVKRQNDGQFSVIPNEGYEYQEVVCANDREAIFDISTNTLTINSVTENVTCQVNFNKKQLTFEVVVKNGKGATTEYVPYGESISTVVQPNDGYQKPKIECTNNQEYLYSDNKLTIQKLTDNSTCTVTFKKTPAVTYNLRINELPAQVTITSGNKEQSIVSGKDGRFSLRPDTGFMIKLDCNGVKPSDEQEDPDGTITYTFLGITKNITCNVSAQETELNNGE